MPTILMSSRHTADDQSLWRAAIQRDWSVVRARGIRVPEIDDEEIILYVEPLFACTIANMLGRKLLDPPNDWLSKLPQEFSKRNIELTTLGTARKLTSPTFVKPPNDKFFAAKVYESGDLLPTEFEDDMPVLVAEPVQWEAEFRCFCLDGQVQTLSPYLRAGVHAQESGYNASGEEIRDAIYLAESVLEKVETPRAIVLDVGVIKDLGWAVIEANGAWGSGIYNCNPNGVLDTIRHATTK